MCVRLRIKWSRLTRLKKLRAFIRQMERLLELGKITQLSLLKVLWLYLVVHLKVASSTKICFRTVLTKKK